MTPCTVFKALKKVHSCIVCYCRRILSIRSTYIQHHVGMARLADSLIRWSAGIANPSALHIHLIWTAQICISWVSLRTICMRIVLNPLVNWKWPSLFKMCTLLEGILCQGDWQLHLTVLYVSEVRLWSFGISLCNNSLSFEHSNIWRVLFQNGISNVNAKLTELLFIQIQIDSYIFICERSFPKHNQAKIGIDIWTLFFGMALNAFWKRALQIYPLM